MCSKKTARWQWISSPLGLNVLLSMFKETTPIVDKYTEINKLLGKKKECTVTSTLFISAAHEAKESIKSLIDITDFRESDFSSNENTFVDWVNKYGELGNDVEKELKECKPDFVLANMSLFESAWESSDSSGTEMKIYNSFNYTQDVKYEARLLELALRSGFKLVVIVPNESDVLHAFYTTLAGRGLTAALTSIQPLFTVNSELKTPCIEICSRIKVLENVSAVPNGSAIQYGSIAVTEKGTLAKVLTCIYSPSRSSIKLGFCTEPPFYFAVVFEDTPIFTGQFTPRQ